jgi:Tol biopolymer transport system component
MFIYHIKIRKYVIFVSCFVLLLKTSSAALFNDHDNVWQTLETDFFLIHFHQGEEGIAKKVAEIAKNTHHTLSYKFKWTPKQKTHLVLTDKTDYANGYATPFPQNVIYIFVSPPKNTNSLDEFKDGWLESVILHEYTHILHMDKVIDGAKNMRAVLGRMLLTFPAIFQPSWITEGLATYQETNDKRKIGRGQSSFYKALMRTELIGGLKSFKKVNQTITDHPMGQTAYLYGVYFFKFIADSYGEKKIWQWVDEYNDNVIPFRLNGTAEFVFGKDLEQLWSDFHLYLQQKFKPTIKKIQQQSYHDKAITKTGYVNKNPEIKKNGDIYFYSYDLLQHPALFKKDYKTGQVSKVANIGGEIFFILKNKTYFTGLDIFENVNFFYDIYVLDNKTHKINRKTTAGRFLFIRPYKNKQMVAIKNKLGIFSIILLNANGKKIKVLWTGSENQALGKFDISPDKKTLILSFWQKYAGWRLKIFDIKNQTLTDILPHSATYKDPKFSKDGKNILFSADINGIYNIYLYNLNTRQVSKLTNVVTAAFEPDLSFDNKTLVYSKLGQRGYDIYQKTLDTKNIKKIKDNNDKVKKEIESVKPFKLLSYHSLKPYSGLSYLAPSWWLPIILFDKNQSLFSITTSGNDPLKRHTYGLYLGYDSENDLSSYNFNYLFDSSPFSYLLNLQQNNQLRFENDKLLFSQKILYKGFDIILPFIKKDFYWLIKVGIGKSKNQQYKEKNTLYTIPDSNDDIGGIFIGHSSLQKHPRTLKETNGIKLGVTYESSDVIAGGDYHGTTTVLDTNFSLSFFDNFILDNRVIIGDQDKRARSFVLGGTFENSNQIISFEKYGTFNQRNFSLRGYKSGLSFLQGNNFIKISEQLYFPIATIENGWTSPPIAISKIYSSIFIEGASVWKQNDKNKITKTSIGAELHIDLILGYNLPMQIDIGYAHGQDDGGDDIGYFRTSFTF